MPSWYEADCVPLEVSKRVTGFLGVGLSQEINPATMTKNKNFFILQS